MPVPIRRIVERAIKTRKQFSIWYRRNEEAGGDSAARTQASNNSHEHFIGILEDALQTLRPCFEAIPPKQSEPPKKKKHQQPTAEDAEEEGEGSFENQFAGLHVEDLGEDADLDIAASDVAATNTTMRAQNTEEVFEIEEDIESELPFIIFCYFQDLHETVDYVSAVWKRVAAGELDRTAASLITNVALELCTKSENEIKAMNTEAFSKASYITMANMIFPDGTYSKKQKDVRMKNESVFSFAYHFLTKYTFRRLLEIKDPDNQKFLPEVMKLKEYLETLGPQPTTNEPVIYFDLDSYPGLLRSATSKENLHINTSLASCDPLPLQILQGPQTINITLSKTEQLEVIKYIFSGGLHPMVNHPG